MILIIIMISLLVILFSVYSKDVTSSIKCSMIMCYNSVIPSLFPFFILCEFLMGTAIGIFKNTAQAAFFSSLLTGFPSGIKNVCILYQNGNIDKRTAVSLLHCTANASPAYITAFIGGCIMQSKSAGYILLLSQTVCAFACAIFFGCFKKKQKLNNKTGVISITEVACNSISNSVCSCLFVCGYIIFFGIIADIMIKLKIPETVANILFFLPKETVKSLSIGVIEITRAINMLDNKTDITCISIMLGFSGLSVIMQCISCAIKVGLKPTPIVTGKLIYTLLMPIISTCFIKLLPPKSSGAVLHTPIISFIMFILFLGFCIIFIYNIFDKSAKKIYNK